MNERLRGVEARILRVDARGRADRAAMKARILAAIRQPGEPPPEDSAPEALGAR